MHRARLTETPSNDDLVLAMSNCSWFHKELPGNIGNTKEQTGNWHKHTNSVTCKSLLILRSKQLLLDTAYNAF